MVLSRVVSYLVARLLSFLFVDSEDHRPSLSLQTLTLHDLRLDPAKIRRILGPRQKIKVISGQVRTLCVDLSGTVNVAGVEIVLGAADGADDDGSGESEGAGSAQQAEGWGEWLLGPMRRAAERALDNLVVKVERVHVVMEDSEGGAFHLRASEMLSSPKTDHQPHLAYARTFALSGFSLKHRDRALRWSFLTERRVDCRLDAGVTADAQSLFVDLVFTSDAVAFCASDQAAAALRALLARGASPPAGQPPDDRSHPDPAGHGAALSATSHLAESVSGIWTKASEGVASLFSPWMKRHGLGDGLGEDPGSGSSAADSSTTDTSAPTSSPSPSISDATASTTLSLPASEDPLSDSQGSLSVLLSSFDIAHSALTVSVTAPHLSLAYEATTTLRAADHVSGLLFECPRRLVGAEITGLALTAAWRGTGSPPAVQATFTRLTALAFSDSQGSPPEPIGDVLPGPLEDNATGESGDWLEPGRPAAVVTVTPQRAISAKLGSVAVRLTPRGLGTLQLALEAAARALAPQPSSAPPRPPPAPRASPAPARFDIEELRIELSSPSAPRSVLGLVAHGVSTQFIAPSAEGAPRRLTCSGEAVQMFLSDLILVHPVGVSMSAVLREGGGAGREEHASVACEVLGTLEATLDGPSLYDAGRLCYIFAGELEAVGSVAAWAGDPVPTSLFREASAVERPRPARSLPPAPPAPVSLQLVCPALRVRAGAAVLTGERLGLLATADGLSLRVEVRAEFAMAEEAASGRVLLRVSSSATAMEASTFALDQSSSGSPRLLKAMTAGASIYDLSMPGPDESAPELPPAGPTPLWAVYSVQRKTEHAVPKVGLLARVSGLSVDLDAPAAWASVSAALSCGNPSLPRESEALLEQLKGPELRLLHLTLRLVARERARRAAELARGPGVAVIRSAAPLGRLATLHRPRPWCRVTMSEVEGFFMGLLSTVSVSLAGVSLSHGALELRVPRALVQSESEEGFEHGRLAVSITAPKVILASPRTDLATARDVRSRVKSTLTKRVAAGLRQEARREAHGLSIASLTVCVQPDQLELFRGHLDRPGSPRAPDTGGAGAGWRGFWRLKVGRADVQAGAWAAAATGADAELLGDVLTFSLAGLTSPGLGAARSIQGSWNSAAGTASLALADPQLCVGERATTIRTREISAQVTLRPAVAFSILCPSACEISIAPSSEASPAPPTPAPAPPPFPFSFSLELSDVALSVRGLAQARLALAAVGTASPDGSATCLVTVASLSARAADGSWRLAVPDQHRVRLTRCVDALSWLLISAEAPLVAVDLDRGEARSAPPAPPRPARPPALLSFARLELAVRSLRVGPVRVDNLALRTNPRLSGAVDLTLSALSAHAEAGSCSVFVASIAAEVASLGPDASLLAKAEEVGVNGPGEAVVALHGASFTASLRSGLGAAWERLRVSTDLGSLFTASGSAQASLQPRASVLISLKDPCEVIVLRAASLGNGGGLGEAAAFEAAAFEAAAFEATARRWLSAPAVVFLPGLGGVDVEVRALEAIAIEAPGFALNLREGAWANLDASGGLVIGAPAAEATSGGGDLCVVSNLEVCLGGGATGSVGALDMTSGGVSFALPEGAKLALQAEPRWGLEIDAPRAAVSVPPAAPLPHGGPQPERAPSISNRSTRSVFVRFDRSPMPSEVPAGETALLPAGTSAVAVQVHGGAWTASTPLSLATRRWVFLDGATSVELAFSRMGVEITPVADHDRTLWRGPGVHPGHFAINSHPLTDPSVPLSARPWGSSGGAQVSDPPLEPRCHCLLCHQDGPALEELHECRDGRVYALRVRYPDLILEAAGLAPASEATTGPIPAPRADHSALAPATLSVQIGRLAVEAVGTYSLNLVGAGLRASATPWADLARADVSLSVSASQARLRSTAAPDLVALDPPADGDLSLELECAGVASIKGGSLIFPEAALTIPGTATVHLSLKDVVDALRFRPPPQPSQSSLSPRTLHVARWRICNSPEVIMTWDAAKGLDLVELLPENLKILANIPDLEGALLRPTEGLTMSNIASVLTALTLIGSPQAIFRTLRSFF